MKKTETIEEFLARGGEIEPIGYRGKFVEKKHNHRMHKYHYYYHAKKRSWVVKENIGNGLRPIVFTSNKKAKCIRFIEDQLEMAGRTIPYSNPE